MAARTEPGKPITLRILLAWPAWKQSLRYISKAKGNEITGKVMPGAGWEESESRNCHPIQIHTTQRPSQGVFHLTDSKLRQSTKSHLSLEVSHLYMYRGKEAFLSFRVNPRQKSKCTDSQTWGLWQHGCCHSVLWDNVLVHCKDLSFLLA